MDTRDLKLLIERTAEVALGPSALRNQGAPGVLGIARSHLKRIKLERFAVKNRRAFRRVLDAETKKLQSAFPTKARNCGAARKALNLYLRNCVYNRYISERYSLRKITPWLEVPLDQYVARGIRRNGEGQDLPRWRAIRRLTPEISDKYQYVARIIAKKRDALPVHLDLHWWRDNRREKRRDI